MKRTFLIAVLLSAYAAVFLREASGSRKPRGFDPFEPRARLLAQRLGAGEYRDALSLAHELEQAFPGDPELLLAFARIWHGLGNASLEAQAWEGYVSASSAPAEACPALAEAYHVGGNHDRALEAYERCTRFDPKDPDRWFDLAQAYDRRGRRADAVTAWRKAAALDPENPWIRAALERNGGPQ